MLRRFNLLCLVLFFAISLAAQDSLYLSLDDLISKTKKESLTIKKGQMEVDIANAEVQKSKEWWLPNIFLGTNFHHLDGRALNSDGRFFDDVNRQSRWYGAEVNLDLNIGKGIFESKSKRLQSQEARLKNEASTNSIVLNGIVLYYELIRISAEKKLNEQLRNNKESLVSQLEAQVNQGLKLESDLLLAKSKAARLHAMVMQLDQHFRHAMTDLAIALNISDGTKLYVDFSDLKLLELFEGNTKNGNNVEEHPLYQSKKFKVEAEEKMGKAITQGMLIPQVGVRYSYGPFGYDFGDNQLTRGIQGYLGWNLPIGQLIYGGDSKISKSKMKLNQLDLNLQKETLTQRIAQYRMQLEESREMIAIIEQGRKYAEQALEQANLRLSEGLGNIYNVLLAEEEYAETQTQYIDAVVNFNLLQYRLWDALGNRF